MKIEVRTPSDRFISIDQAIISFHSRDSSLFCKIDAIHELFKQSTALVEKQHQTELQILFSKIDTGHDFSLLNESIMALERLPFLAIQSVFFRKKFQIVQSIQRKNQEFAETFILTDEKLIYLIDSMRSPLSAIRKYPFRKALSRLREKNPNNVLFTEIKTETTLS